MRPEEHAAIAPQPFNPEAIQGNTVMPVTFRAFRLNTVLAAIALGLTACGGGSDDPPAPDPTPDPTPGLVTLQGQVTRNAALKNVTVCLDLNGNDQCDADEPKSAPTGADGKYLLQAPESDAASGRLIALVRAGDPADAATAIDANKPAQAATTADYVMSRPAGSDGGINPLTTLVQAGVAVGMTEAAARANVAVQLGLAEGKIDDYQDDPTASDENVQDSARWIAAFTSIALREGVALEVGDQATGGSPSTQMSNLTYAGANDWFVQTLQIDPAASDAVVTDQRAGKTGGVQRPDFEGGNSASLYATLALTPNGWQLCNRSLVIPVTLGTPSRSVSCTGSGGMVERISFSHSTSVADEAMTALVTRWQTDPDTNRITTPNNALASAVGSATFPAGSQELLNTGLTLASGLVVDNAFNRAQSTTLGASLQEMTAKLPVSGVKLATGGGMVGLGLGTAPNKAMRVAFGAASNGTAGAAQFYECTLSGDFANTFADPPNCKATTLGSYSIETVHGVEIMRFAGHPPVTDAIGYSVVLSTVASSSGSSRIYRAHEQKRSFNANYSSSKRLNRTAWEALKAKLGL